MNEQHKIALLEDSADNAEVFTEFLRQFCDDLEVVCFRNGSDFLKTFQKGIYRVAVLDLATPEIDGYEVLRRIRLADPHIPAIAFTAHAGNDTRQKAREVGFNGFVTKPVEDMDAFCRMIVDFVSHRARTSLGRKRKEASDNL
jgi:two-component system aerobic respiration control sensor histidine kinase ArcB